MSIRLLAIVMMIVIKDGKRTSLPVGRSSEALLNKILDTSGVPLNPHRFHDGDD